jgi:hypothetical protein
MRRRIIWWALIGVGIAVGWTAYAFATAPDYETAMTAGQRAIWAIAVITCPIILRGARFYWVIPINGALYAAVGFIVETLRRLPRERQTAQ